MITFEKITKTFKANFWSSPFYALNEVSFEVPMNKTIGFLGANGAGKTTSLKILMGFIKPSSGKVIFSGQLKGNREQVLSQIGYFPERPYFYPHLTGKEFIQYMGQLCHMRKREIDPLMKRWSERLKIDHALDRKIRFYSKGMLQRLGFITAVVHDPKVIILDEPLSGLDPIGRKEFKDAIKEIHQEGKTVFFSSHIVHDLEEICQDVICLEKGKLVYQGSVEKLINEHISPNYVVTFQVPSKLNFNFPHKVIEENKQLGSWSLSVAPKDKEKLILDVVRANGSILSLAQSRPTLEEIFYKVKSITLPS